MEKGQKGERAIGKKGKRQFEMSERVIGEGGMGDCKKGEKANGKGRRVIGEGGKGDWKRGKGDWKKEERATGMELKSVRNP